MLRLIQWFSNHFREFPNMNSAERVAGGDHATAAAVEGSGGEREATLLLLGRAKSDARIGTGQKVEQVEAGRLSCRYCDVKRNKNES